MADPIISNSYVGDGSTVLFSFTFPYISQGDVYVSLDKTLTTEYTFANVTTIEFDTAPADGVAIEIFRNTQVTDIENVFYPGSAIRAKDLNDNFTQSLYVIQEGDLNVGEAVKDATEALETANEALENSEEAIETAEEADRKSDLALEAAENAAAVEIGIKPEYNTPGDKDSGIRNLYNEYPQKLGRGMTLPDQNETWAETGALRVNTDNEKLEVHLDGDWTTASAGAEVSESPPSPATQGDVWWDPSDGRGYVYYTDSDSSQWVEMNPSWNGSIPDGGVTPDKIQDGAVTPEKLDREYLEPGEEAITQIIGGENVTVDPADGKGVVTINAPASGGGGGTVINYNGASAWGEIINNSLVTGSNVASVTKVNEGRFQVVFTTPLSSSDYAVVGSTVNRIVGVVSGTQSVNGFTLLTTNNTVGEDPNADTPLSFAVHSSNAIAPQSGVGADAWVLSRSDGTLDGSYNIDEVNRSDTGTFDVTFVAPMPSINYAVVVTPTSATSRTAVVTGKTTTGFRVFIYRDDTGATINSGFAATVFASSTVTPTYTWTRDGTTLKPANDGDNIEMDGKITLAPSTGNAQITYKGDGTTNANNFWYSYASAAQDYVLQKGGVPRLTLTDGSATFANTVVVDKKDVTDANANNLLYLEGFQNNSRTGQFFVKANGNAVSNGSVLTRNVVLNLDPDNSANYVSTTNADGETESVYNGPTLDVKEMLLGFQAKIETLEAAKAALEARITTLEGGAN